MHKTNCSYLLLFILLFLTSCDDDQNVTCNDPTQIIDDCGICRESETSDDWNATMDNCGICNGSDTSCSGCMDPEALTYDETALFHDLSDCNYNLIQLFLVSDEDGIISIEPEEGIDLLPNNIILGKSNQYIGFTNLLNDEVIFSLENNCIKSYDSCSEITDFQEICDLFDGCEWNQGTCIFEIETCHNIIESNECIENSNCEWNPNFNIPPSNSIPYLIKFKYPYTYDYSITIPWLDNYTINGSIIIVNNYEN